MGPVWDFDYMTFNPSRLGLGCKKSLWYDKLLKNEKFVSVLKRKWNSYKEKFLGNETFIDSIADYIHDSNERNHSLWPIDLEKDLIGDEKLVFNYAVELLKDSYINEIYRLDLDINELP